MIYKIEGAVSTYGQNNYRKVYELEFEFSDETIHIHSKSIDIDTANHDDVEGSHHNEFLSLEEAKEIHRALGMAIDEFENHKKNN